MLVYWLLTWKQKAHCDISDEFIWILCCPTWENQSVEAKIFLDLDRSDFLPFALVQVSAGALEFLCLSQHLLKNKIRESGRERKGILESKFTQNTIKNLFHTVIYVKVASNQKHTKMLHTELNYFKKRILHQRFCMTEVRTFCRSKVVNKYSHTDFTSPEKGWDITSVSVHQDCLMRIAVPLSQVLPDSMALQSAMKIE